MLLRLASRNLWRNRRRTLLTLSAMVVSLALLTLSLGVFSGMLVDILSSTTEQYHGHVVITAEDYLDDRDMYKNFSSDPDLLKKLEQEEAIVGISERLRGFGLVSHADSSYPAELLGIRPEMEQSVTNLHTRIVAGRYLLDDDTDGAVIGVSLAKKLGAEPGDEQLTISSVARSRQRREHRHDSHDGQAQNRVENDLGAELVEHLAENVARRRRRLRPAD